MVQFLVDGLTWLQASGQYDQIRAKWGIPDALAIPVTVNPTPSF
jgi:hypothetical protein